jgi:hypothetical protein
MTLATQDLSALIARQGNYFAAVLHRRAGLDRHSPLTLSLMI